MPAPSFSTPAALLALGLAASAAVPTTAAADAFADRAAEIVADYGASGSYYVNPPSSGTALTEWKKGVFAAALAAFVEGQQEVGRSRANAGLDKRSLADMFYLYGLVELWQRKPLEFAHPVTQGQIDLAKVKEALWTQCWHQNPGTTDNHRLMYNVAALFGATNALTNARNGQTVSSCTGTYKETLAQVDAHAWIEDFIDETVIHGYPEADSATYATYYLAPLRLLADHYAPYHAGLANKAGKAFDALVSNMAGEWTNGSFTATTSRQYFPADGSVYRPIGLGNYLRVLFGGRVRSGLRTWEDSGGGIRKAWAATAVPLALTAYRPAPELLVAATDRSVPFVQRESTRMSTAGAPSYSLSTRYVEPGLLELASASDAPSGWGSQQGQNLTLHTDSVGHENRTLTVANPQNSSPWTSNVLAGFKALGARPDLQWLQDGRSALGVLVTADGSPTLMRGSLGDDLLQASWGAGTTSGNPWHVFGSDNKLWIGVRSVASLIDEGSGDPLNALDDSWLFRASNPGGGRGSYVIIDAVPQSQMSRSAFANALNRSSPPRVVCTGIVASGCSMPSANARPTVTYTNLAGRTLKLGFPDGSGPAQRWLDGALQTQAGWPTLESPWAQQDAGSDVLRVSAITGSNSTTRVTEYKTYTTVSGTQSMGAASGRLESWTGSAPNLQPAGWVNATWAGAPVYARSTSAHTGSYAAQVSLSSSGNGGFSLNAMNRPSISSPRVTVTAWLKPNNVSRGPGEGAYVFAQYVRADGTPACSELTSTPLTGTAAGWQSRSVTLPPCANGAVKVAISVRLKGTGSLLVDDIDYAQHP